VFFFEKRTKKLLSVGLGMVATAPSQTDKSLFASFSSEKEDLPF
jgi:hypothetical protein